MSAYYNNRPAPPINGDQVVRAVRRFCVDHKPLPETVTFHELIAQGYLASNVLQKFGASAITVHLNAVETSPEMLLMDAQMPDGTHQTLLSDGSVQQLSKSRFQDQTAAPTGGAAAPSGNSAGSGEGHHR
ncbi:MAG: hypothetical protein ABSF95_17330 [Verrucomicrobiota bacterium]